MSTLNKNEVTRILLHYYTSLNNLTRGAGTEHDIYILLRVCEILFIALGSGIFTDAEEARAAIAETAIGLRRAAARAESGEAAGLDGATYQAVKDALVEVERLLSNTSVGVIKRWLDEQDKSIRTGVFQCLNYAPTKEGMIWST
jgi:hypothetical protein